MRIFFSISKGRLGLQSWPSVVQACCKVCQLVPFQLHAAVLTLSLYTVAKNGISLCQVWII
jgi:hypothetical protein